MRGPSAIFYIDEPDLVQEAVGSNTNSVMKPAAAYFMILSVALAFPRVGLTEPHESDRQASNHLTVLVFYHFHHVLAVRSFFFSFFSSSSFLRCTSCETRLQRCSAYKVNCEAFKRNVRRAALIWLCGFLAERGLSHIQLSECTCQQSLLVRGLWVRRGWRGAEICF